MFPLLFLRSRAASVAGPSFDATTDATLLCEEGGYSEAAGNGTFVATVGSNLTEATVAPVASAGAPDFDGATNRLVGGLPATYGITGNNWSGLIAYTLDAAGADGGAYYILDGFWGDRTDGYLLLGVFDNGDGTVTLSFGLSQSGGAVKVATTTVALAGRHVVHWKYTWDGVSAGSICVGVDGVWGTPTALTAVLDPLVNGHVIDFGRNYNAGKRFNGRQHSIGFYDVVVDDTFVADWIGAYG